MSRNDWFEAFLRARVQRETPDLDIEQAWVRLQQRRRERRRRRIFFLMLWGLIAGAGIGIWYWSRPANDGELVPVEHPVANFEAPTRRPGIQQEGSFTAIGETLPGAFAEAASVPVPKMTATGRISAEMHENILPERAGNTPTVADPVSGTSASISGAGEIKTFGLFRPVPALPLAEQLLVFNTQKTDFQHIPAIPFASKRKNKYPKWLPGLELGYGLQFADRSGGDADWLDLRSGEEETLDIFSAAISVQHHLSRRWFLQTGLGWVRCTDRRTFLSEKTVTEIKLNQLVQVIIHADGSQEEIFSDAPVTTVTRTEGVQYNRFDRIEIPVLAGLEFFPDQKIGLSAAAGLAPALAGQYKGFITDSLPGQQMALSEAGYRKSGLLAGVVRLELGYHMPLWMLGLSVQGRTDLLNTTKTGALFKEKRSAIGLVLSFRRNLADR